MAATSTPSAAGSMPRRVLVATFQAFIVICLIDGFLDITYPALKYIKEYIEGKFSRMQGINASRPDSDTDLKMPRSGLPVRHEPGIHNILKEYKSAHINITPDGNRDNGQLPQATSHKGIVLGSSTAFGYGVKDSQTISSQLERELQGVRVFNYAGLGQPTSDSILRWYDLQRKHGSPDFVIVAGINYQIYTNCLVHEPKTKRSNIFLHLAKVATNIASFNKQVSQCESSNSADLAVRDSIASVESAVSFGRKMGSPFYLVYLPTPYEPNAKIDHLINNESARKFVLTMQKVYAQYRQELKKLALPELIDLSESLPSDKIYFQDLGGHLSAEGNEIVSKALSQHIRPIVSLPPRGNFKPYDGHSPANH